MKGPGRFWSRCAVLALLPVIGFLSACGSGSSLPPAGEPTGNGGWVSITEPATTAQVVSRCNTVYLSGSAFVSPTLWAPGDYGVRVTWQNLTTLEAGDAVTVVDDNMFAWPNKWWAYVPLGVGRNLIRIRAAEKAPGTLWGTAQMEVDHPSRAYSLSGTVLTADGQPFPGLALVPVDVVGNGLDVHDSVRLSGQFSVGCLSDGDYLLTALSAFGTPSGSRSVTVGGSDVAQIELPTTLHLVSGRIATATGADPVGVGATLYIGDGATSVYAYLDVHGDFALALGDGVYTLSPGADYGYTFAPGPRTVTVAGHDVPGILITLNP